MLRCFIQTFTTLVAYWLTFDPTVTLISAWMSALAHWKSSFTSSLNVTLLNLAVHLTVKITAQPWKRKWCHQWPVHLWLPWNNLLKNAGPGSSFISAFWMTPSFGPRISEPHRVCLRDQLSAYFNTTNLSAFNLNFFSFTLFLNRGSISTTLHRKPADNSIFAFTAAIPVIIKQAYRIHRHTGTIECALVRRISRNILRNIRPLWSIKNILRNSWCNQTCPQITKRRYSYWNRKRHPPWDESTVELQRKRPPKQHKCQVKNTGWVNFWVRCEKLQNGCTSRYSAVFAAVGRFRRRSAPGFRRRGRSLGFFRKLSIE